MSPDTRRIVQVETVSEQLAAHWLRFACGHKRLVFALVPPVAGDLRECHVCQNERLELRDMGDER